MLRTPGTGQQVPLGTFTPGHFPSFLFTASAAYECFVGERKMGVWTLRRSAWFSTAEPSRVLLSPQFGPFLRSGATWVRQGTSMFGVMFHLWKVSWGHQRVVSAMWSEVSAFWTYCGTLGTLTHVRRDQGVKIFPTI